MATAAENPNPNGIKIGDQVELKSGSPLLTVYDIKEQEGVAFVNFLNHHIMPHQMVKLKVGILTLRKVKRVLIAHRKK